MKTIASIFRFFFPRRPKRFSDAKLEKLRANFDAKGWNDSADADATCEAMRGSRPPMRNLKGEVIR